MNNNCLIESSITIPVSGSGATLNLAIEDAFRKMRVQLSETVKDPIIGISTEGVRCNHCQTDTQDEAFLFFFFKRQKKTFNVELDINLKVQTLNIGGV